MNRAAPWDFLSQVTQRMGFELQYDGLQRGFDLTYPHFDAPASLLLQTMANSVWDMSVVKIRHGGVFFFLTRRILPHICHSFGLRPGELWPHAETIFLVLAATLDD